jgi:hypothetical protein
MERYNNFVFSKSSQLDVENNRRFYTALLDPTIERQLDDIYVVCQFGDRFDLLASKYYDDATLWWIISAANPEVRKDSLFIEPGTQLRIPRDFQRVLSLYAEQNLSR